MKIGGSRFHEIIYPCGRVSDNLGPASQLENGDSSKFVRRLIGGFASLGVQTSARKGRDKLAMMVTGGWRPYRERWGQRIGDPRSKA